MSKNTENYKLYTFTNDSDVADLKLLEPTFDTIDKGLTLDVGESSGEANNYVLNLGSITLNSANKGISFKFWADKNSTGAVTINGTYKLIKASGSSVTNLKAGAPYTITYDGGTNFFLASGGGTDTVNFTSSKLLTGYSANDSNGEKIDGTMPENGAVVKILPANGIINLGSGHYDSIKITQYLNTRGVTIWKPSPNTQSIPAGTYLTGTQTIEGDKNLAPQNIRAGVSIFGIDGILTIQSLGGYSKQDIKNNGIITRYKVVKQSEKALNTNGKSNMMYEVLQKYIEYVRSSGDKYSEVFCIDNNLNNLIFCRSNGTASTKYNEDYYDYLQYVDFNSFTTTSYRSSTSLPLDQVGEGKKYHTIPLTGNTKYGKLVVNQSRSNSSSGNSWCSTSTIRLQTKALTYDLLTLDHYGWLFNYSASSDTFTTIVNKKEGSSNVQYKTVYKIVPEVVDKNGNVIS